MIPIYSKFVDCYAIYEQNQHLEFLLLYRNKNELYPDTWQSIQGKIKLDETAVDAARREVAEETQLEIKSVYNLDIQNSFYYPKTNEMYIFPTFVFIADSKRVGLSKEHTKFKWMNYQDALEAVIWRSQKNCIMQIQSDFLTHRNEMKLKYTQL